MENDNRQKDSESDSNPIRLWKDIRLAIVTIAVAIGGALGGGNIIINQDDIMDNKASMRIQEQKLYEVSKELQELRLFDARIKSFENSLTEPPEPCICEKLSQGKVVDTVSCSLNPQCTARAQNDCEKFFRGFQCRAPGR